MLICFSFCVACSDGNRENTSAPSTTKNELKPSQSVANQQQSQSVVNQQAIASNQDAKLNVAPPPPSPERLYAPSKPQIKSEPTMLPAPSLTMPSMPPPMPGAPVRPAAPPVESSDKGKMRKDVEKESMPIMSEEANVDVEYGSEVVVPETPITLPPANQEFNTESYQQVVENPFLDVAQNPMSTFSIDVDTAAYTNMRRFFNMGQLPPPDAIRIEEMVNYFRYSYPQPIGDVPFSVNVDLAECPWSPEHRLARIGLKGKEISQTERANTNLVFLLDVSGSMFDSNKLPLVKEALKLLVQNMRENDKVGIVVYAGSSGVVLPPTSGANKQTIISALDRLQAGGSTNAGQGIELAYKLAGENFIPGGVNRVIIATDGDFNVGVTSHDALLRLIQEKAKSKVFLTVLGFGMGNYKDDTLELLADKGNGNYAYIDDMSEAKRVLVEQIGGTLVTIAKDVKIQVEFNPALILQYRLIGYENRVMPNQDFNDDTKDAGEIGAGHTVTAFYELVPVGVKKVETGKVDPLKYQTQPQLTEVAKTSEAMTVKLRYKAPEGDVSKLLEFPIRDEKKTMAQASPDLMFASSVVCFGMILQDSKYKGNLKLNFVLELAEEGLGNNPDEYRKEFINLVKKAQELKK